jgi:ketopantoate reductase
MNILIIGTGVIGCVYGWQLSEAGYTITHFVRPGQKQIIDEDGIIIRCLDARMQNKPFIETLYNPNVAEQIDKGCYDFIIVPVKANQLNSILPILGQTEEQIPVLFLQNLWITHIKQIDQYLNDSRIVYGQAHMVGGGKEGNLIKCTIFGNNSAPTMLGKRNGDNSQQIQIIRQVMSKAGLNPKISKNIFGWLFSHYAEANGLVAGVMEAGTAYDFIANKEYIKHSVRLIREGFKVCSALNIQTWKIYPQVLYYSPMWCLLPALLKMYRTEETQLMIQEHIKHSLDEMKQMFYDVFESGKELGLPMTYYKQMQKYFDGFQ